MDLILWRHAQAQDQAPGGGDMARALTPRGEKQAARMAQWLGRQLPEDARILCSPALRCEQTVRALARPYELAPGLAPGCGAEQLLEVARWPLARETVLLVGHQPTIGEAVSRLLALPQGDCPVRKGAVWWLRTQERDGHHQTLVVAVHSPDTL